MSLAFGSAFQSDSIRASSLARNYVFSSYVFVSAFAGLLVGSIAIVIFTPSTQTGITIHTESKLLQNSGGQPTESLWNAAVDDIVSDGSSSDPQTNQRTDPVPEWNAASNDASASFVLDLSQPSQQTSSNSHIHFQNGRPHPALPASVEASMVTHGDADVLHESGGGYYLRLQDGEKVPDASGPAGAPAVTASKQADALPPSAEADPQTANGGAADSVKALVDGLQASRASLTPPSSLSHPPLLVRNGKRHFHRRHLRAASRKPARTGAA